MPCRTDDYDTYGELKKEADKIADLLCTLCYDIETLNMVGYKFPKKVKVWWDDHKVADEKRRKLEEESRKVAEIKQEALAKLSIEERKALGLK
jgi:hypothetical protein